MSMVSNVLPSPTDPSKLVEVSPFKFQASQPGMAYFNPLFHQLNKFEYGDASRPYKPGRTGDPVNDDTFARRLRRIMQRGDTSILGNMADFGPFAGALTYGVPLALFGAGSGYLRDSISGSRGSALKYGLGAGLIGAGLGGYSGWLRKNTRNDSFRKAGSYLMGSTSMRQELIDKIKIEPSADMRIKMELIARVQQMSEMQARQLYNLALSFGGGSLVAFLAHKLLGTGLLGSAAVGAMTGTMINSFTTPRDAFGRRSTAGFDMYGRPI